VAHFVRDPIQLGCDEGVRVPGIKPVQRVTQSRAAQGGAAEPGVGHELHRPSLTVGLGGDRHVLRGKPETRHGLPGGAHPAVAECPGVVPGGPV